MSINKKLTDAERQRHRYIREQIKNERAELIARGKRVKARHDTLRQAVAALKATRESLGLTLTDIKAHTGIEKSNLSRLETIPIPTRRLIRCLDTPMPLGKRSLLCWLIKLRSREIRVDDIQRASEDP